MIGVLASDCEKIPADVTTQLQRSECNANATEAVDILAFHFDAMRQHSSRLQSSGPTGSIDGQRELEARGQRMQARIHSLTDRFCNHAECSKGMRMLKEHNSECFADGICAGLSQHLRFELCRPLMRRLLLNVAEAEMDSMCAVEPGTDMYCPEVSARLMTRHLDCFAEMHRPAKGCSPKCQAVWRHFRSAYPECSAQYAEQVARSQTMMSRMFSIAGMQQGMSGVLTRSGREICADLDDTLVLSSSGSAGRGGMSSYGLEDMARGVSNFAAGMGNIGRMGSEAPSFQV